MDLRLYGLDRLEEQGHDACEIATFCRNPLHPGPCKGWKRTLQAVAPGLHKAVEDTRLERVHKRRAERAAAHKAAGTKAPRVRKLKHERAAGKGGPRDGDGDGKLREGEYEKRGRSTAPKAGDKVKDNLGNEVTVTMERGKGNAKSKAALEKWDASGGTGKGMTDKEVGEALTGAQANSDWGSAVHIVEEYKRRLDAKRGQGGKGVGSTRTNDGKGDTVEETTPKILKGPRQRESLGAVVRAGEAGYENKRGFLNKKDRDWMVAEGFVEVGEDGKLRATDAGRATHEASIPRRNGEEIGFDGKTASERQAELDAAQGKEKARLEAEAKERFEAGIPPLDARPALADMGLGRDSIRVNDASRKLAAALQKDLGEGREDYAGDVGPAAQAWHRAVSAAASAGAAHRQTQVRQDWLKAAQVSDPDNAVEYKRLYDETRAAGVGTADAWEKAIKAANAAKDTLGEAIIGRYQTKGKRKTLAGLKLPTIERPNEPWPRDPGAERIRAAAAKGDADIKGLDHNLEPWQVERATQLRNDHVQAVIEREKADAALQVAQDQQRDASVKRSELLRRPAILRDTDEGRAEHDAAYAEEQRTGKALRQAEDRRRAARDWVTRSDAALVDGAQNLRAEQVRNGGARKETGVEKERRQRLEGGKERQDRRDVTDAAVRAMATNRTKLLAEAKKRGITPERRETDDSLIQKIIKDEERRLDAENPPGLGGLDGVDPEVRAEVANIARRKERWDTDAGHDANLGAREIVAREQVARGQIPWTVGQAALEVARRKGADIKTSEGMAEARRLMGLPAVPKGTGPAGSRTFEDLDRAGWVKMQVKRSELRAGDLTGNLTVLNTSTPDERGRVQINGMGWLGLDVERNAPDELVTVRRPPGGPGKA